MFRGCTIPLVTYLDIALVLQALLILLFSCYLIALIEPLSWLKPIYPGIPILFIFAHAYPIPYLLACTSLLQLSRLDGCWMVDVSGGFWADALCSDTWDEWFSFFESEVLELRYEGELQLEWLTWHARGVLGAPWRYLWRVQLVDTEVMWWLCHWWHGSFATHWRRWLL
jgi:hypothetical protein